MSSKDDKKLSDDDIRLRVAQGLQQKKKCSLCLQYFYVDELPGAITYKSILELRSKWGVDVRRGNKLPSPSQLYRREELCTFCMQFFDVDALPADAHASLAGSGGDAATSSGSAAGGSGLGSTSKRTPGATAAPPGSKPAGR